MRLAHGMAFWIISDAISYIEYDCPKAQFLILRESVIRIGIFLGPYWSGSLRPSNTVFCGPN